MNIINQSNDFIIQQIGGFQYKTEGKKYRLNKYCIECDIEDGKLIHNGLTGATVMIRPFEYINIYTDDPCDYAEFLVNNYFLVPEDFDEKALVDLLRPRKQMPITSNYLDHPKDFTILSTTKCNARCFYCYEMHNKGKHHMTLETAEKVAKYIIKVAPKNEPLRIGWFGGEPLFNYEVIDIITSRIASAGFRFTGSMITNGYLFNEQLIKRAKSDWHIDNVQITLDGTESVYNKTKNYIYKEGNPYEKVIQNIRILLQENVHVSIRMNCDTHNSENLVVLVNELHSMFKEFPNFSMYVWPIFDENNERSLEENRVLYESLYKIDKLISDLEYPIPHGVNREIKCLHCMVDTGNGVTISPSGDLGVCEHFIDSDFIGHIDNPYVKDFDVIKTWRDYTEYKEICEDCPIYPACLKMKKCPDESVCDIYQKQYHIEHTKLAMIYAWRTYLYNKTKNNKCDSKCNKNYDPNSQYQKVVEGPNGKITTTTISPNEL